MKFSRWHITIKKQMCGTLLLQQACEVREPDIVNYFQVHNDDRLEGSMCPLRA